MLVQWCIKGLSFDSDDEAMGPLTGREGLLCNWWRNVHQISPQEIDAKLTPEALERHVNHFDEVDPVTKSTFREVTPFISLTAGTVERDRYLETNTTHSAQQIAIWFGTRFGQRSVAYLYRCWVVVAPTPAPEVALVAEEVRELNTYRSYSSYQVEGEIAAKISVPSNQILSVERWDVGGSSPKWRQMNPTFVDPSPLLNVRDVI